MIIEDDESDSTDTEIRAETITSTDIESGSPEQDTALYRIGSAQDPTSELSISVHPSAPNIWYDVEDGRYVDENELLPGLELGEPSCPPAPPAREDLLSLHHHPRLFAGKISQHESDRITRPSSTEPAAHTVSEPVDQDGGGWNKVAIAELEKEVDLVNQDQDRLSVASLSCSPCSPRRSIELPPHPSTRQSQSDEMLLDPTPTPRMLARRSQCSKMQRQ